MFYIDSFYYKQNVFYLFSLSFMGKISWHIISFLDSHMMKFIGLFS